MLIVLDNVRADSMSLYGRTRPTTPRLEELARGAVPLEHGAIDGTLDAPLTREHVHWSMAAPALRRLGCGLDETYPTLAEFLAGKGYATAGFVANTYYLTGPGLDRGFARYEDFLENQIVSLFEPFRSTSLGEAAAAAAGLFDERSPPAMSVRERPRP